MLVMTPSGPFLQSHKGTLLAIAASSGQVRSLFHDVLPVIEKYSLRSNEFGLASIIKHLCDRDNGILCVRLNPFCTL